MGGFFTWLTNRVEAACLAGVQRAVDKMNTVPAPVEPVVLRLAAGEAEAEEPKAAKGGRGK